MIHLFSDWSMLRQSDRRRYRTRRVVLTKPTPNVERCDLPCVSERNSKRPGKRSKRNSVKCLTSRVYGNQCFKVYRITSLKVTLGERCRVSWAGADTTRTRGGSRWFV